MDQEQGRRYGGPVLFKKGDVIPEHAHPMSESEVITIQNRRIKHFKPLSEMRAFTYGTHVMSTAAGISGLILISTMRKNFRLGGLRKMFTYIPSVVLSGVFAGSIHETIIKPSILLGKEGCPLCVSIRSGTFQMLMGLVYPSIISFLSCLPVARENYTLPMPAGPKGRGYLRLMQQVSPTTSILVFIGLSNMLVGMLVAKKELETFAKHLSKPPMSQGTELDPEMMKE